MQVFPLIESLKVKDFIIKGLPAKKETNKEDETNSEYEMPKEKNLMLVSWITWTLSEEVIYLVVGCNTAKEIWLCLEENLQL